MKTKFKGQWFLVLALSSLAWAGGCQDLSKPPEYQETIAPTGASTNASHLTNAPAAEVQVVQPATVPEQLTITPALGEVIKMAQAGVSDEVMLAYIAHSPEAFGVDADTVLYLNDLGVSGDVVTALINHKPAAELEDNNAAPADAVNETVSTNALPTTQAPAAPQAVETAPATEQAPAQIAVTPEYVAQPPVTYASPVEPGEQVNVSYFYDSLAPYGNWVYVNDYGLCWQPTVAVVNSYWRPYGDRGHWLWTDSGWYWRSDYSWGWAPFHYGRWCQPNGVGWVWVPGSVWGPAWVSWRHSDYYCGWAPLPPAACYRPGFGFSYFGASVGFGFEFGLGLSAYNFVPLSHFHDRNLHRHYVSRPLVKNIYKNSTVVNNYVSGSDNTVINEGIGVKKVSRASGVYIEKVSVRKAAAGSKPGLAFDRVRHENGTPVLYRPQLSSMGSGKSSFASTANAQKRSVNRAGVTRPGVSAGSPFGEVAPASKADLEVNAYKPTVSRSPLGARNGTVIKDVNPSPLKPAVAASKPGSPTAPKRDVARPGSSLATPQVTAGPSSPNKRSTFELNRSTATERPASAIRQRQSITIRPTPSVQQPLARPRPLTTTPTPLSRPETSISRTPRTVTRPAPIIIQRNSQPYQPVRPSAPSVNQNRFSTQPARPQFRTVTPTQPQPSVKPAQRSFQAPRTVTRPSAFTPVRPPVTTRSFQPQSFRSQPLRPSISQPRTSQRSVTISRPSIRAPQPVARPSFRQNTTFSAPRTVTRPSPSFSGSSGNRSVSRPQPSSRGGSRPGRSRGR